MNIKVRTKEMLAHDMSDEIETILYALIVDAGASIADTMPSINSIIKHYIINGGVKKKK